MAILLILSQGKYARLDLADYKVQSKYKWYAKNCPYKDGKDKWYASRKKGGKTVYLHREITQCLDSMVPDHLDGDGLNCVRKNLELVTKAQNTARSNKNRKKRKQ